MYKTIYLILIFLILAMVYGCSLETESLLQNASIITPPHKKPVRIVKDINKSILTIRGSYSSNLRTNVKTNNLEHSKVDVNNEYQIEPVDGENYYVENPGINVYDFAGDNINWNLPDWQGGLEFEMHPSPNLALLAGLNLSEIEGKSFWGTNLGIGFLNESDVWGWRFDAEVKVENTRLNIDYVIAEEATYPFNQPRKVWLKKDQINSTFYNVAIGLSFNTRKHEWPVNYFFSYTLGWQSFFDVQPNFENPNYYDPNELSYLENYHSLSGGFFKDISETARVLAGGRVTQYTDPEGNFFIPDLFLQLELIIF